MRIVIVLKGTLSVHALNYVTSLVILYEFTVSDVLVDIAIEFRLFCCTDDNAKSRGGSIYCCCV